MKKLTILSFLVVTLAIPSLFAVPYSNVSTVGGYGPYQTGQGGEFTLAISATQPGGSPLVAGTGVGSTYSFYSASTRNQYAGSTNFQTFCVEGSEYIYANTSFDATVATSTKFETKELTIGAAWLYSEFASGALDGYNYGSGRTTTAGQLQQTIWWLMGTEGYTQTLGAAPSNHFTDLVKAEFSGTTLFNANAGYYNVAILRLWADGDVGNESVGNRRQDQLVMTGEPGHSVVPDGGWTITLLGMSLAGVAALRRKFLPAV